MLCPQKTTFVGDVTMMNDAMLDDPPEISMYYIPKIEPSQIVSVWIEGKMVPPLESGVITDVASQKAFFVQTESMLFKTCLYKKFPGGAYAGINVKKPELGSMDRRFGALWMMPAFNLSDLFAYFQSFGCDVKNPEKLIMSS